MRPPREHRTTLPAVPSARLELAASGLGNRRPSSRTSRASASCSRAESNRLTRLRRPGPASRGKSASLEGVEPSPPGFEYQAPHPGGRDMASSGGVEPPPPSFARSAPNPSARTLCWSPESNRSRSRTGRVLDLRAAPAWWTERESNPRRAACKAALRPSAQPETVESAGIEPASPRCERGVLPLNDDPVGPSGIEPESTAYKAAALPLSYEPVRTAGIEPASPACRAGDLPLIYTRIRWWTGGDSNPGFRDAIAASSRWTTSP